MNPGEEVIVFAPYFLEYGAYVRNYDGVLVEVAPDTDTFQLNLSDFEKKLSEKTKAVIINIRTTQPESYTARRRSGRWQRF